LDHAEQRIEDPALVEALRKKGQMIVAKSMIGAIVTSGILLLF
jgi:hypothetical protein